LVWNIEKGVEMGESCCKTCCWSTASRTVGANIDKEGIQGPLTEDHDFCWRGIHGEESHHISWPDGAVSNFVWMEPKVSNHLYWARMCDGEIS
jgi:hypothetical protein